MALGSKNVLNEGTNNISVGSERIFKKVQMLFLPKMSRALSTVSPHEQAFKKGTNSLCNFQQVQTLVLSALNVS